MSMERSTPSAPSAARPALPREVEGFRLLRELGRGGMGVVYEAEELASGRLVALKVLASELRVSEEAFGRFQQEARLAAAISDPACVFVYGAHSIEGSPAIAMELCGGETLEARLRRPEPIPIETAVRWTMEILDGLEAAHAEGVVHRDVKPSNCFQTADGRAKIGDFGLARTLERDVGLTQSGAFLGSPLYASPEQVRGRQVDLRSDIYSAAATLYALLTGRPPHSGGGVGEVLARILSEPVDAPRTIRPEVPRGLERVVLKAMSKEPADRFKSFAAFRKALAPFEHSTREPARRGLRLAAFVLDGWLIGVATAGVMMGGGLAWVDPERTYLLTSLWMQLLLTLPTLLYFGLCEGLLGATPAKWLFGLRVISRRSGQPDLRAALLRVLVFESPQLLVHVVLRALPPLGPVAGPTLAALIPGLLHLAMMASARRANGWRGLHELASGTRTVQVHVPFQRTRPLDAPIESTLQPAPADIAQVGIYALEGVVGRSSGGRLLRGRDPDLGRSVWILEREGAAPLEESRRTLERRGRLRWLASLRGSGRSYEVFEDPGGASLADLAARSAPLPWPLVLRLLRELAEELEDVGAEGAFSPAQAWIDRSWHLRLLDERLEQEGAPSGAERTDAVGLLGTLARALLREGDGRAALPSDLPLHAEATFARLTGTGPAFADLREARSALDALAERPQALTRNARLTQLALAAAVPTVASVVGVFFAVLSIVMMGPDMAAAKVLHQIENEEKAAQEAHAVYAPDPQLQRDRQVLVAGSFRGQFGPTLLNNLRGRGRELRDEALRAFPSPSAEEVAAARERLRLSGAELNLAPDTGDWIGLAGMIPAYIVGVWGVLATLLAFFLRGGLSLRLTGMGLRTRRGRRASRLRAAWRALLGWLPIVALLGGTALLADSDHPYAASLLLVAAVVLGLGGVAFSALAAPPSLQDRLAGTRLAPR